MLDSVPGAGRRLGLLVVAAAVLWHLVSVLAPARVPPPPNTEGRDFASYYYAARVAAEGGDPYDKASLDAAASADGTRPEVHPFFYPPPFLWLVAWSPAVTLKDGFFLWIAVNELALLIAAWSLVRWWRPLGGAVLPLFAALAAVMYAVAYSFELGQANFPVLALVLAGLWQERDRPWLGGVLVGLAAMLKMSPALFLLWWLLRGRTTAVVAAVLTAVATSLLTLPLLGFEDQLGFYTAILPRFGSGDYNGLVIQIDMFANHSVPNLLHQLFPSGENRLSSVAQTLSGALTLGLLGSLGWLFRRRTDDPVTLAAQACAVLVAMLLVPVYTYEHHLVFALPAMVFALLAVERGWLSPRWALPLGGAVAVLLYDQLAIRAIAVRLVSPSNLFGYVLVQELKFLALLVVGVAVARVGATALEDRSRPPAPAPAR
jgi:alpha-1,2-mannosyltransferase